MNDSRHQELAAQLLSEIRKSTLESTKSNPLIDQYVSAIASAESGLLRNELNTDHKRKAFWINVYNAMFQHLNDGTGVMESALGALRFFNRKGLCVSGHALSLNDVEHGLLRRSRIWWARGYLRKVRASDFERDHRVDRLDPRIHFALNCGALSCPPIRFYKQELMDDQLDMATRAYLETTVAYDREKGILQLPGLMKMYWADFGRRAGAIAFVNAHSGLGGHIDATGSLKIIFSRFERSDKMANFEGH